MATIYRVQHERIDEHNKRSHSSTDYAARDIAQDAVKLTTRLLTQAGFIVTDCDDDFVDLVKAGSTTYTVELASMRIVPVQR